MYLERAIGFLILAGMVAAIVIVIIGLRKQCIEVQKVEGKTWVKVGLVAGSVIFGFLLLRWCFEFTLDNATMSPETYQIVRLTVGLAAGFIAAGLAGSFQITGDWQNASIKAGGPTGVAIFFYLVNPMGVGV